MDTLKNRLYVRKQAYKTYLIRESQLEQLFKKFFTEEDRDSVSSSLYSNSISLYFTTTDPEFMYLTLIPKISAEFGPNWNSYPDENGISFFHSVTLPNTDVAVTFAFTLNLSNSCVIQKIPTGRTVLTTRYETKEVPEFTYQVSCGGE